MCKRRYHSAVILPIDRNETACHPPGENGGGGRRPKLTEAQCREARAIFAEHGTIAAVARHFKVGKNCAYHAVHGHRHPAIDTHVARITAARTSAVAQDGVALPTYNKRLWRARQVAL